MNSSTENSSADVIGIIPAAGYAKRIYPLPCSKEIYPVIQPDGKPRAVSCYLMDRLRKAGVRNAYMIIRNGKWDIPEYFSDGANAGLNISYRVVEETGSVPSTIDKAYPFVKNGTIVLGFPDILFQPADAFSTLLYKQQFTGADLVLGLFRAVNPEKVDMVEFNDKGAIKDIIVKPDHTTLTYTWIIAVWTSRFTDYMHRYLAQYNKTLVQNKKSKGGERESAESNRELDITGELFIGKVFRDAIQSGLQTSYVIFKEGSFLDIGTPDDLMKVNNIDWMKQFNMRISV